MTDFFDIMVEILVPREDKKKIYSASKKKKEKDTTKIKKVS